MADELFFVGIKDPIELRKDLLTGSKDLIDSLRRYEQYKDFKRQKLDYIMELKRVFDELLVLNKKVRGKLPRTPLKSIKVPLKETPTTKTIKGKKVKIAPAKIDLLEQELANIEKRLGSLE